MKLVVLYRTNSEEHSKVEELVDDFKRSYPKSKIDILNVDSRDGIATASIYDILRYPSILAVQDDGTLIESWQGVESLPRVGDLSIYT